MRVLYYVPVADGPAMEVRVPPRIGPLIGLGVHVRGSGDIVAIDYRHRTFKCFNGTVHALPDRYYQTEGNGEDVEVVTYGPPSEPDDPRSHVETGRYGFRWPP